MHPLPRHHTSLKGKKYTRPQRIPLMDVRLDEETINSRLKIENDCFILGFFLKKSA